MVSAVWFRRATSISRRVQLAVGEVLDRVAGADWKTCRREPALKYMVARRVTVRVGPEDCITLFHDGHENLIRLLVWSGVALALLGLFYKIVGRGGIHEEAFQDDWGHVVRPAKSASATPPAQPKMPAVA